MGCMEATFSLLQYDDCLFGLEERTPIHEAAEQITASPPPYNSKEGLNINNGSERSSSGDFMSLELDIKDGLQTSLGLEIKKEPETPSWDDLMSIKPESLPHISELNYRPLKSKLEKQSAAKVRKKACSMCRSSKTKCEGPRPCRRCVKLGRPEMCTPQTTLPVKTNESKKSSPVTTRKRQREMHTMEYDPYVCFAAGLVYNNNIDLLKADGFSVQISFKSTRKRLKDDESIYKGQQCYRNSWCVRQFRHCGHCKSSESQNKPKKRKTSKIN